MNPETELHAVQPEDEPIVAEVEAPDLAVKKRRDRRQQLTVREIGATRQFHVDCPCCGLRFAVDYDDAQQSALDRAEQTLKRKTRDHAQRHFADVWKWKTHERKFDVKGKHGGGKDKSKAISSDSVDMVMMTGAGKHLRSCHKKAKRMALDLWFAVLWHDVPTMGENFVAFPLGRLFECLQAIADDAPEFRYRLRLAADNAVRRDESAVAAIRGRPDREVTAGGGQSRVEAFDDGGAVEV